MSSDESSSEHESSTVKSKGKGKLPPLTSYEKELLLQIVAKPAINSVVENKGTNVVWTAQKDASWENVSQQFCSHTNVVKRPGPKLKKAWENLKSRAKKQMSKARKRRVITGGGPKARDVSPTSNKVAAIVPAQMVALTNMYDDDASDDDDEGDVPSTGLKFGRIRSRSTSDAAATGEGTDHDIEHVEPDALQTTSATDSAFSSRLRPEVICAKAKPSNPRTQKPVNRKRKLLTGQEIMISMEEELEVKKLKLLDLQISREQARLSMEQEYHKERMKLVKMQISTSNDSAPSYEAGLLFS